MKRAVVILLALAGCGDDNNNMVVIHDMAVKTGLDANMGIPIGGQCTLSSDCKNGENPACRKNRNAKTGMCTADCRSDADCGAGNVCLFEPGPDDTEPGACAKACELSTDCTEGLGCWISLDKVACWPLSGVAEFGKSLVLNCDPTVAGCTFAGSNLPGGCSRQILGSGNAGVCRQGCELGVGTCPNVAGTSMTFQQSCYFVDESIDTDNMPTGDLLKMPLCGIAVPEGTPPAFIPDGAECLDPASQNHYYNICFPGSQCETYTTVAAQMPDNKCHRLCYLGNFTPPDAGALFTDGGIAMGCSGGQTCQDIFGAAGLMAPGMPVGLCK